MIRQAKQDSTPNRGEASPTRSERERTWRLGEDDVRREFPNAELTPVFVSFRPRWWPGRRMPL